MENIKKPAYDLEERLLEYSVRIIKVVAQLPNTKVGNHVAGQLLRSETSKQLKLNCGANRGL